MTLSWGRINFVNLIVDSGPSEAYTVLDCTKALESWNYVFSYQKLCAQNLTELSIKPQPRLFIEN